MSMSENDISRVRLQSPSSQIAIKSATLTSAELARGYYSGSVLARLLPFLIGGFSERGLKTNRTPPYIRGLSQYGESARSQICCVFPERRLRKENARLLMEREILKKAAQFFAWISRMPRGESLSRYAKTVMREAV